MFRSALFIQQFVLTGRLPGRRKSRGVKAKLGYWDMGQFTCEIGILACKNRDIGIPITDLGYGDIAQIAAMLNNNFMR